MIKDIKNSFDMNLEDFKILLMISIFEKKLWFSVFNNDDYLVSFLGYNENFIS